MPQGPTISCIVPVFNGAQFLAEALQSILAQTRPPDEILVVDDGSTDATPAVAGSFGDRIRYFQQSNQGPAAARNRGVREAGGEFLSFLDADDLWHEEKLARQLARFEARPELELSLTYKRTMWTEEMRAEQQRLQAQNHPFIKDHPGYVCQTMLMPRATFDRVGPLDESMRIGEDTDWLLRAGRAGVVREILPDVLVYRRMHGRNLSYSRYTGGAEDQLKIVLAHLKAKRSEPR